VVECFDFQTDKRPLKSRLALKNYSIVVPGWVIISGFRRMGMVVF